MVVVSTNDTADLRGSSLIDVLMERARKQVCEKVRDNSPQLP